MDILTPDRTSIAASYRAVAAVFVVLCLFPWVSFGLLDLDTQPWFIFAALVFCALSIRIRADTVVLSSALMLAAAAVLCGITRMRAPDLLLLRGILSYTGFSAVLLGYYYYRRQFGFPWSTFIVANVIWLLVGLIQTFTNPRVFSAFVVVRTTADRGVTGLSPEPTFYGLVLLLLSWIFLVESDYRPSQRWRLLLFVNVAFIMLVAKSAMAMALVLLLLLGYVILGATRLRGFIYVCGFLVLVLIAASIVYERYPDWRVFRIITALVENPLLAIKADASVNERFAHLVFSFYGAVINNGIPGGFHTFSEFNSLARAAYGGLFWFGEDTDKIMSGIGAVVYELGWFSLIFFALVAFCALSRDRWRISIFHLIGFLGLFSSALSVAFPLVPIFLVTMLFWRRSLPKNRTHRISSYNPIRLDGNFRDVTGLKVR